MRGQLSGRTILCVDDHEIGLKVRKRVLEMAGYTVLIATRAHEALELFRTNHIDLVIAEHIAPAIVDGPTLAATMKMLKPEVPVAIFSADVQVSPEDRRFADAYITKLVPIDELLRLIRKLLGKRKVYRLPRPA
jgi:CheY-like chemotaxis protein